ncbi:4'-phosphopantetheinyl transferase [Roseateles asaccharophilus]
MAAPGDWLTPTEQARFQSLGSTARRDTFLAGRWLARRAVQRWLQVEVPPALAIADSGACVVDGVPHVQVSISHSSGMVACAASDVPVGVDLERLGRPRDHLALAETVHGIAQREQLVALPAAARELPFLTWWTLKEAWLKARGRGLDFAQMRALVFDDGDAQADVAVTTMRDFVLAVACVEVLPLRMDGLPDAAWCRSRARLVP